MTKKKKGHTQCVKLQLLRHLGEVIVASLTPIFFFSLERLIPRLESTTCRFWQKTLSIAPRPGSTSKVQQMEIPKMPTIKLCNIKTMKYTYKGQYQHPLSEKGQSLFNPKSQLQSQFKPERRIRLKKQYYIMVLGSYVSFNCIKNLIKDQVLFKLAFSHYFILSAVKINHITNILGV